ncbi:hypothetical protein [Sphingobacterium faecium]|uniref:hypothetical protein n=1 Tax=Sphingobacterium faecium TaxID=34087 RepID=UPI0024682FA3|nr:hypothetical protein [Sphingobacterium faecium]MDH5825829.1 hypothetical protein [Sphingobacterium faecium]
MPWYSFTPGAATPQDPSDPNQYTLFGMTPPPCPGGCKICAIQAMDNMGKPIITLALLREIIRALHNCTASTNVLLCP